MHQDVSLIATIAVGFALAFFLGFIAHRLRLPPLVGYLLGGVAMGRFTPGFVGDSALARQLAEIGVMLLMFGVGLHFSLDDLLSVRGFVGETLGEKLKGANQQQFATLDLAWEAHKMRNALAHLGEVATFMKVLGSYPRDARKL